ncbi:MAG: MscL family protein [Candidatus Saccharimonadales bacterium]
MAEQPKVERKVIQRREVTVSFPVVKAPGWLQGFVDFFREQGVVSLAVGFTFGVAAKTLIDSIVNNIVNPIVGYFYGGGGQLADKYWCMKGNGAVCSSRLGYGAVASQIINLLIVALVIYFVIKAFKLDKLDKKK